MTIAAYSNLTAIVNDEGKLVEIIQKLPSGEIVPLLKREWVLGADLKEATSPLVSRGQDNFDDEEIERLYGYEAVIPPLA